MKYLKRLLGEIKIFNNSEMNKDGIYLYYDEANLNQMHYLIMGPDNTPYAGGFYLFKINFTEDYPFKPPKVKYISYCTTTRMNPNMYCNGKVCLSILGTWDGPPWTPAMNLCSLAHNIQLRLNNDPLHNEPGYENDKELSPIYNKIISYHNIRISVIKTLKQLDSLSENIQSTLIELFMKNYTKYLEYLTSIESKDGTSLSIRYANSNCTYDVKSLKRELDDIHQKYL